MKPVALIILVLAVYSESFCTRTLYRQKRIKNLANEELKNLLKRQVDGLKDDDCTITYQVTFDDEEIPFYPFLIDRQGEKVFGMVQLNNKKYNWTKWDSKLFTRYYKWCHEDKNSDRFQLPLNIRKPLPEDLECRL